MDVEQSDEKLKVSESNLYYRDSPSIHSWILTSFNISESSPVIYPASYTTHK